MDIQILQLTEGARQAKGLTVIIDVFRAFTAEAYMACNRAEKIIPVGDIQTAFDYKAQHPEALLCGEREGKMIEGFDFGNSPSQLETADLAGKTIVHTTSAGTQGIANAISADEIIAGSLVCARAIVKYIRQRNPETVSLVCMGLMATTPTEEDTLCAEYIKSRLEGKPLPDLEQRIQRLKETDGAKFFDPAQQDVFPERDFHLSVQANAFHFILRLKQDPEGGLAYMERVDMSDTPQARATGAATIVNPGNKMSQFTKEQVLNFPDSLKCQLVYGRHQEPEGKFDCALVLGGPSEFMESRAQAAADLYFSGRVPYLMVSGGVYRESPFGTLTEAQVLARYLEKAGVPSDRITLEDRASTTVENMKFCNNLLQERFPGKPLRLAVVTSNFHVYRATQLAKGFFPEYTLWGVGATYPKDNAEEYLSDPVMPQWVTNECRCLWGHTRSGLVPDFTL